MRVEVLERFSVGDTIGMLRKVPLLDKPDVFPYAEADIDLRVVRPRSINPIAFYLLEDSLKFQREFMESLFEEGIDTLNLDGSIRYSMDGQEPRILFPPVVEVNPVPVSGYGTNGPKRRLAEQDEHECDREHHLLYVPVWLDGLHRVWLSMQDSMERISAVYITGAHPDYPVYAFPNDWNRVKIMNETPKDPKEKKLYRVSNPKPLYRNFGVFNGSGMRDGGARSG